MNRRDALRATLGAIVASVVGRNVVAQQVPPPRNITAIQEPQCPPMGTAYRGVAWPGEIRYIGGQRMVWDARRAKWVLLA